MYNVNPGIMASIISGGSVSYKLIDIITRLGLTTNLEVCLDVGDTNSYPGTGQTWSDVSGNGNHYYLGTTSGVDAGLEPTFTGTAGDTSSSTYWSMTGEQYFTETTAQTFQEPFHKDGGVFTILGVPYFTGASTIARTIWSSGAGGTSDAGVILGRATTTTTFRFFHSTTNTTRETLLSTVTIPSDTWNVMAVSFDEPNTSALFRINSTEETVAAAASTSTEATPVANRVLLGGAGGSGPQNGDRFMCMAIWSTNLSSAQLGSLYTELKKRNPGIP
jgi:hypothetical protein